MHSGPHPSSGGKEGNMHIKYRLENGTAPLVPAIPETVGYILRNDREMANAERRERYHAPYHIEAMAYEGMKFAYLETPEDIIIRKEENERLYGFLWSLTPTQRRRLLMKAEGKSLRYIAAVEGTTVNAVRDSLKEVMRRAEKDYEKY